MYKINYIDRTFKWAEYQNQDVSFRMERGKYIIEHHRTSGYYCSWLNFRTFSSLFYKIEAEFQCVNSSEESWYGLIWGGQNINSFTTLQISGKGDSHRVCEIHQGIWRCDGSWSQFITPINRTQPIKVEILVDMETYSSKIVMKNIEMGVTQFNSSRLGNNIGFVCGPTCNIEVYSLIVSGNPNTRRFLTNSGSNIENNEFHSIRQ